MLGAALNHSALNLANALGAWLGGLVIAAGFGLRAPSVVGAGLAAAGLVPLAVSAVLQRRSGGPHTAYDLEPVGPELRPAPPGPAGRNHAATLRRPDARPSGRRGPAGSGHFAAH